MHLTRSTFPTHSCGGHAAHKLSQWPAEPVRAAEIVAGLACRCEPCPALQEPPAPRNFHPHQESMEEAKQLTTSRWLCRSVTAHLLLGVAGAGAPRQPPPRRANQAPATAPGAWCGRGRACLRHQEPSTAAPGAPRHRMQRAAAFAAATAALCLVAVACPGAQGSPQLQRLLERTHFSRPGLTLRPFWQLAEPSATADGEPTAGVGEHAAAQTLVRPRRTPVGLCGAGMGREESQAASHNAGTGCLVARASAPAPLTPTLGLHSPPYSPSSLHRDWTWRRTRGASRRCKVRRQARESR